MEIDENNSMLMKHYLKLFKSLYTKRLQQACTVKFERVRGKTRELYLLAKQRQKGCDGMGEVATLKDELIYLTERNDPVLQRERIS